MTGASLLPFNITGQHLAAGVVVHFLESASHGLGWLGDPLIQW